MAYHSLEHYCETAKALAVQAGHAIMDYVINATCDVTHKADQSPLTAADLAAHAIIAQGLNTQYPDIPLLSEEGIHTDPTIRSRWNTYWLVDPLDGTREFLKGNGEFTVNIALISDKTPVVGVVFSPVTETLYWATADGGAYQQVNRDTRPLITRTANLDDLILMISHYCADTDRIALTEYWPKAQLVSMGSSLKICLIAAGQADIYPRFGPTSEWDTAAADCILTAAGGKIIDVTGEKLRYNKQESLLNPWFLAMGDTTIDWLRSLPNEFIKPLAKE